MLHDPLVKLATGPERSMRAAPTWHRCVAVLLSVLLGACSGLPAQPERPPSTTRKPSPESALVKVAQNSTYGSALTGFRLLPLGYYSLDARIQLARKAQDSLDVQYYLIRDDRSGRLFMRTLRDAAMRGVRIRLLVDDLYTAGSDPLFRGLAAFPNVEVRLFNPFCCARQNVATRFLASVTDLRRLNHRMHNKLLIADGAFAVLGGRNIADEYFARSSVFNFVDMDVLVAGAVVPKLATIFDTYWNSPQAYRIEDILGAFPDPEEGKRSFKHLVDEGDQMMSVTLPSVDMFGNSPISNEIDT